MQPNEPRDSHVSIAANTDLPTASFDAPNVGTDRKTSASDQRPAGESTTFPDRIGRFEIRSLIGRGGFGAVYLAFDPVMQRRIALKVAHHKRRDQPDAEARILNEARSAARLQHANVVSVYEVGDDETYGTWIAMEYVDGESLDQVLRRRSGPMPLDDILRILIAVAEGVHAAHKQGVYHRDLKPANVLVAREDGAVKVADFGLSLLQENTFDSRGRFAGTLAYSSPEQVRGETHQLDGRADIWSLGVLLYEMMAGRRPFLVSGETPEASSELRQRILETEPQPLEQISDVIPQQLIELCRQCLSKNPSQRPATALQVSQRLRESANLRAVGASRRAWWWQATALAGAVVGGGYLAQYLRGSSKSPDTSGGGVGSLSTSAGSVGETRGEAQPTGINRRPNPAGAPGNFDLQGEVWDEGYAKNSYGLVQPDRSIRITSLGLGLVSIASHDEQGFELAFTVTRHQPGGVLGVFWNLRPTVTNEGLRIRTCRGFTIYERARTATLNAWPVTYEIVNRSAPRVREELPVVLASANRTWNSLRVTVTADGGVRISLDDDRPVPMAHWLNAGQRLATGKLGFIVNGGDVLLHQVIYKPQE